MNFLSFLVAALSSLVVGMVWYNPKTFGNVWMKEAKITFTDKPSTKLMVKTMVITFVLSFLVAMLMSTLVIHQSGVFSLVAGSDPKPSFKLFMDDYGQSFRTFKHGFVHGILTGVFFVVPVVGISAMYEMRSWKYVFIVSGYWIVTLAIMGGIICAWK